MYDLVHTLAARGRGLRDPSSVAGAAARGVVGAMAMTGMRRLTIGLGLLERTPPETIAEDARAARRLVERIPRDKRDEAVELAHWSFGAVSGVGFALLPAAVRGRRWSGPLYGLAVWALFESLLVPALSLAHARQRTVLSRLVLAADHLLYGAIVGGTRPTTTAPASRRSPGP